MKPKLIWLLAFGLVLAGCASYNQYPQDCTVGQSVDCANGGGGD